MTTDATNSKDTVTTKSVEAATKPATKTATKRATTKAAPAKTAAKAKATRTAVAAKTATKTTKAKAATPKAAPTKVATKKTAAKVKVAPSKPAAPEAPVEINTQPSNTQVAAKALWYVGLGVYGYSYDRLMMRKAQAAEKGQQVFERLFERGETLQEDTETALADVKNMATESVDDTKARFSGLSTYLKPFSTLSEISNKLDTLNKSLDDKVKKAA